jgi:hypothetical protein
VIDNLDDIEPCRVDCDKDGGNTGDDFAFFSNMLALNVSNGVFLFGCSHLLSSNAWLEYVCVSLCTSVAVLFAHTPTRMLLIFSCMSVVSMTCACNVTLHPEKS